MQKGGKIHWLESRGVHAELREVQENIRANPAIFENYFSFSSENILNIRNKGAKELVS